MAARGGPVGPSDNSFAVRLNRWTLSASRHYLRWITLFLGLYTLLPIAAPIFMHVGLPGPGDLYYLYAIVPPVYVPLLVSVRRAARVSPRGGKCARPEAL